MISLIDFMKTASTEEIILAHYPNMECIDPDLTTSSPKQPMHIDAATATMAYEKFAKMGIMEAERLMKEEYDQTLTFLNTKIQQRELLAKRCDELIRQIKAWSPSDQRLDEFKDIVLKRLSVIKQTEGNPARDIERRMNLTFLSPHEWLIDKCRQSQQHIDTIEKSNQRYKNEYDRELSRVNDLKKYLGLEHSAYWEEKKKDGGIDE